MEVSLGLLNQEYRQVGLARFRQFDNHTGDVQQICETQTRRSNVLERYAGVAKLEA